MKENHDYLKEIFYGEYEGISHNAPNQSEFIEVQEKIKSIQKQIIQLFENQEQKENLESLLNDLAEAYTEKGTIEMYHFYENGAQFGFSIAMKLANLK